MAKYVSNGDYGVRSDNSGSLTWLGNTGERGFTITRSTAPRHMRAALAGPGPALVEAAL